MCLGQLHLFKYKNKIENVSFSNSNLIKSLSLNYIIYLVKKCKLMFFNTNFNFQLRFD